MLVASGDRAPLEHSLGASQKQSLESENNNIEDSGLQHFNVNSTQRPVVEKFLS